MTSSKSCINSTSKSSFKNGFTLELILIWRHPLHKLGIELPLWKYKTLCFGILSISRESTSKRSGRLLQLGSSDNWMTYSSRGLKKQFRKVGFPMPGWTARKQEKSRLQISLIIWLWPWSKIGSNNSFFAWKLFSSGSGNKNQHRIFPIFSLELSKKIMEIPISR